MTRSQLVAWADFSEGSRLEWHVPLPRQSAAVLLVAWLPLLVVLGCCVVALVGR